MIFKTFSGSAYEVDSAKKQIRRLYGAYNPTPRTGQDGAWKGYSSLSDVTVGHPVMIQWDGEVPTIEGLCAGTLTSPVTEILTSTEMMN